jgi:hypothetical protein
VLVQKFEEPSNAFKKLVGQQIAGRVRIWIVMSGVVCIRVVGSGALRPGVCPGSRPVWRCAGAELEQGQGGAADSRGTAERDSR